MRRTLLLLLLLLLCPQSRASCGAASCPIDLNALNNPDRYTRFALDLSMQYIDQDDPRGRADAAHHVEVRTINRIATMALTYAATDRLQISTTLPFISRDHLHLEDIGSERFDLRGFGDTTLTARYEILPVDPERRSLFYLIGGVKLPTGSDDRVNDEGETAELPIQTGSGATDGIVGFSYQNGIERGTTVYYVTRYFITTTYQFRGSSNHGRLGNELQVNAGGAYPFTRHVEALLQLNTRVRGRDHTGDPEDTERSGGTYVYASPGVRFTLRRDASLYGLVQVPVYQDVNGLQLTSKTNYIVGVQTRF